MLRPTPAEIELGQRAYWLVQLRWITSSAIIYGTFMATTVMGMKLDPIPLYLIGAAVAMYNSIYIIGLKWTEARSRDSHLRSVRLLTDGQIATDLLSLTLLIHFTGGIENPLAFYFIFHVGIAHDLNVGKITVVGVPDRPGLAALVFEPLAVAGISVDVIVQNVSVEGSTDLSFTVARADLAKTLKIVEPVAREIGARQVQSSDKLGKVSVVGAGIQSAPGIAAAMFKALYDAGLNIEMISTSEIRITCIVDRTRVEEAVRTLHATFELDRA